MMAAAHNSGHTPVMIEEVLAAMAPLDGEVYVDATFGGGGYTRALLEAAACRVIAIDRDPAVIPQARLFKERYGERFLFCEGVFGNVEALVADVGESRVDGIVLDIGVSSMQLDQPERGFSFRHDGPLDMRMGQDKGEQTAADLVNNLPADELADLIYKYGEERRSRQVARAIVEARRDEPITTTGRLAEIVRRVVRTSPADRIDPATRTFQALRIAVNEELSQLESALEGAEAILRDGGRLVVVTFHSLEDRIVKSFLKEKSGRTPSPSRHVPVQPQDDRATFKILGKAIKFPAAEEIADNSRAGSARLRAAVRVRHNGRNDQEGQG